MTASVTIKVLERASKNATSEYGPKPACEIFLGVVSAVVLVT